MNEKKSLFKIEHLKNYRCLKSKLYETNKGINVQTLSADMVAVPANNIIDSFFIFFNRLNHFTKDALEENLYNTKSIGRFKGMRTGLYIVAKDFIETFYTATYEQREQNSKKTLKNYKITKKETEEITRFIMRELKNTEKTKRQLTKNAPEEMLEKVEMKIGERAIRSTKIEQILNTISEKWQIIPGKDKWDSAGKRYTLFEELHNKKSFEMNNTSAESRLVMNYIAGYGPVCIEDIAWWCGFTMGKVQNIIKENASALKSMNFVSLNSEYFILAKEYEKFVNSPLKNYDSYIFLGKNDPLLMGYKILLPNISDEYLENVFHRFGESESVILINGRVAGIWSFIDNQKNLKLTINLFKQSEIKIEDKINRVIDKLGDFIAGDDKEIYVELSYLN